MFDYETEDENNDFTFEDQFIKETSFSSWWTISLQSVKNRFQPIYDVANVFSFLFIQENLLSEILKKHISEKVSEFSEKDRGINPFEMEKQLRRFIWSLWKIKKTLNLPTIFWITSVANVYKECMQIS